MRPLLALLVVLSSGACGLRFHAPPGANDPDAASILVSNASSKNVGVARYQDPVACTGSAWLLDDRTLAAGASGSTRLRAGELQTILFSIGDSYRGGGSSLTLEWCYVALTFKPEKGARYRFVANSDGGSCRVRSELEDSPGHWVANRAVTHRDTSGFNAASVTGCRDRVKP